jgi:Ca2+/Na+ antiporter
MPLFRRVAGSDELVCYHVTYSRISPTLLPLRGSLSARSSSCFLLVALIAFVRPYFNSLFINAHRIFSFYQEYLFVLLYVVWCYFTFSYRYVNSSSNQTSLQHCKWNPMFVMVVLITHNIETLGHILNYQLNRAHICVLH